MSESMEVQLASRSAVSRRRGFAPSSLAEFAELAKLMVRGGFAPRGMSQDAAVAIVIAGDEIGLGVTQSLQSIQYIQGRPTVYGDGVSALILSSGLLEGRKVEWLGQGDERTCVVTLKRRGVADPFIGSFSVRDAKKAGLANKDNWRQYEERMLYWRAFSFAARDGFADVLRGIAVREEVEDFNFKQEPVATEAKVVEVQADDEPRKEVKKLPAWAQKPSDMLNGGAGEEKAGADLVTEEDEIEEAAAQEPADEKMVSLKRGRGRPAGAKNKPKAPEKDVETKPAGDEKVSAGKDPELDAAVAKAKEVLAPSDTHRASQEQVRLLLQAVETAKKSVSDLKAYLKATYGVSRFDALTDRQCHDAWMHFESMAEPW